MAGVTSMKERLLMSTSSLQEDRLVNKFKLRLKKLRNQIPQNSKHAIFIKHILYLMAVFLDGVGQLVAPGGPSMQETVLALVVAKAAQTLVPQADDGTLLAHTTLHIMTHCNTKCICWTDNAQK